MIANNKRQAILLWSILLFICLPTKMVHVCLFFLTHNRNVTFQRNLSIGAGVTIVSPK